MDERLPSSTRRALMRKLIATDIQVARVAAQLRAARHPDQATAITTTWAAIRPALLAAWRSSATTVTDARTLVQRLIDAARAIDARVYAWVQSTWTGAVTGGAAALTWASARDVEQAVSAAIPGWVPAAVLAGLFIALSGRKD